MLSHLHFYFFVLGRLTHFHKLISQLAFILLWLVSSNLLWKCIIIQVLWPLQLVTVKLSPIYFFKLIFTIDTMTHIPHLHLPVSPHLLPLTILLSVIHDHRMCIYVFWLISSSSFIQSLPPLAPRTSLIYFNTQISIWIITSQINKKFPLFWGSSSEVLLRTRGYWNA